MAGDPRDTTDLRGSFNITDTEQGVTPDYCINGVPVVGASGVLVEKIVEVSGDYVADGDEAAIFVTGAHTITIPGVESSQKSILIESLTATTTVVSSSSIDVSSITASQSRRYFPISSGWKTA